MMLDATMSAIYVLPKIAIFPILMLVFSGLRLALGTALIVIVAVEFVRVDRGVGFLIYYYWLVLVTPRMYAALVVVMALGVCLTALLQWVERRVMPWRRG